MSILPALLSTEFADRHTLTYGYAQAAHDDDSDERDALFYAGTPYRGLIVDAPGSHAERDALLPYLTPHKTLIVLDVADLGGSSEEVLKFVSQLRQRHVLLNVNGINTSLRGPFWRRRITTLLRASVACATDLPARGIASDGQN